MRSLRCVCLLALAATAWGSAVAAEDLYQAARQAMVDEQIKDRGLTDPKLLEAMAEVPRHLFVPEELRVDAYADKSLAVSSTLAIQQPYIVALMTSLLHLDRGAKVLEIGTGTGYHAAVLAKLAGRVFSIEIDQQTSKTARANLDAAGFRNVHTKVGDGYQGWPEEAPFDAIILTAAPPRTPQALLDQLRIGGRMVVPVGDDFVQDLLVITRTDDGYEKRVTIPVKLPPMSGEAQKKPR